MPLPQNVGKEGAATHALAGLKACLGGATSTYREESEILGTLASLLEAGEHLPTSALPSARVLALGGESPANHAQLVPLMVRWGGLP